MHLAAAGEPGAVVEGREPDAAPLRALRGVERLVRALLFAVAGERERPLEHGDPIGAVPDHLAGRGGLAVPEQVPTPQLHRIEP